MNIKPLHYNVYNCKNPQRKRKKKKKIQTLYLAQQTQLFFCLWLDAPQKNIAVLPDFSKWYLIFHIKYQ